MVDANVTFHVFQLSIIVFLDKIKKLVTQKKLIFRDESRGEINPLAHLT
jgi:hypothetical protein